MNEQTLMPIVAQTNMTHMERTEALSLLERLNAEMGLTIACCQRLGAQDSLTVLVSMRGNLTTEIDLMRHLLQESRALALAGRKF